MKMHLLIGSVLAIIVALVVVFGIYQEKAQAPAPAGEATSTPEMPGARSTSSPPVPQAPQGQENAPTIPLTPYTVYIGGATQFGTSSQELMQQEGTQVVVGYEWEALPPGPQFDSITLPSWDESDPRRTYEVYVSTERDGEYPLLGEYPSGQEVQFPRDGARGAVKFKVLGIDPKLRICPGDRSFNWEARFTLPGRVGLVRTPITQELFVVHCKMR